jgi:hypothetical protein
MLGLSVSNLSAQQTLILQASDTACTSTTVPVWGCFNWKHSISSIPAECRGGGYWNETYNGSAKPVQSGSFLLSHNAGESIYSYWGGFTTGSNGDNYCYGDSCKCCKNPNPVCDNLGSGSWPWVTNQWGVMAGGGLDANNDTVKGQPYFIAYWDYFSDGIDPQARSLWISLDDDKSTFAPQEIWICNHPWPYYGNIYGDGFAHPFDNDTCLFQLIITGYDSDNNSTGSIVETLAQGSTNGPVQSLNWRSVDLSYIGEETKTLVFTMYSTDHLVIDGTDYGPNTAVYFNMDKLKVDVSRKTVTKAVVQKAKTSTVNVPKAVEVKDYFPVASYTGGAVIVYDNNGKEALRTSVKAGEKVNLSQLPVGEYRLKHGHKHIPIKKIK